MNVLLYLYYPFFDTHLAGGVQVYLRQLVEYILAHYPDIQLTILCPESDLHTFPMTFAVDHVLTDWERDGLSLEEIRENFLRIQQYEKQTDVLWLVDRAFPIPSKKPTVLSLNTICYEREAMAVFQSGWNVMAVPSIFVKEQVDRVKLSKNPVYCVPFYADPIFLRQRDDIFRTLRKYFDYRPNEKRYILFPHRPDRDKGHSDALSILQKVVRQDDHYQLLIPLPPQAKLVNLSREMEYINRVKLEAVKMGLEQYVIFHPWVDYTDIPCYYNAGDFTLFLSRLPETFGLTLLNSALCGTPTISYGTGALPEIVPPGNSHIVVSNEQEAAQRILAGKRVYNVQIDIDMIKRKYTLERISARYVALLRQVCGKEGKS